MRRTAKKALSIVSFKIFFSCTSIIVYRTNISRENLCFTFLEIRTEFNNAVSLRISSIQQITVIRVIIDCLFAEYLEYLNEKNF